MALVTLGVAGALGTSLYYGIKHGIRPHEEPPRCLVSISHFHFRSFVLFGELIWLYRSPSQMNSALDTLGERADVP